MSCGQPSEVSAFSLKSFPLRRKSASRGVWSSPSDNFDEILNNSVEIIENFVEILNNSVEII